MNDNNEDNKIIPVEETGMNIVDANTLVGKGRYKKYVPKRIADSYLTALTDEDILSSRDSIALTDARIVDLLQIVDSGVSGKIWTDLRECVYELKTAQALGDKNTAKVYMNKMFVLIDQGYSDHQSWKEVFDLIEIRRRLSESEQKRLISLQQVFTAEQGIRLIRVILTIVKKHVKDIAILQAISDEISGKLATNMNPKNIY